MLRLEQTEIGQPNLNIRRTHLGADADIQNGIVDSLITAFSSGFPELHADKPYYREQISDFLSQLLISEGPQGFAFYRFYFDNEALIDIAAYWQEPLRYPLNEIADRQTQEIRKHHEIFDDQLRSITSSTLEFVSPSGFKSWDDFLNNYFSTTDGPIRPFLSFKTQSPLPKIDRHTEIA